jgi:hypothetical protein
VAAPKSLYYPCMLSGNPPSIASVIGVREELRTGASEDRWMVALWCDEYTLG